MITILVILGVLLPVVIAFGARNDPPLQPVSHAKKAEVSPAIPPELLQKAAGAGAVWGAEQVKDGAWFVTFARFPRVEALKLLQKHFAHYGPVEWACTCLELQDAFLTAAHKCFDTPDFMEMVEAVKKHDARIAKIARDAFAWASETDGWKNSRRLDLAAMRKIVDIWQPAYWAVLCPEDREVFLECAARFASGIAQRDGASGHIVGLAG